MSITDNAKELVALIKTLGDTDLYGRIVELEADIVTLKHEAMSVEQQLSDLKRHRGVIDQLAYEAPFYVERSGGGLFCPRCVEVDQRAVHLVKSDKLELRRRVWSCPECQRTYADTRQPPNTALHPTGA
jgi:hypothetical protein